MIRTQIERSLNCLAGLWTFLRLKDAKISFHIARTRCFDRMHGLHKLFLHLMRALCLCLIMISHLVIFPCILLIRNYMIFLVQFGINKHLLIFQRPQTELDDKKYCHRLIKTMTKFEKEIRHRLFVFIKKKKQQLTRRNARQQHAFVMRFVLLT